MAKFRFLIERSSETDKWRGALTISQITPEDDSGSVVGYADTLESAQAQVEADYPDETISWKPAPKAWQPDALSVSNYLDDGVEENCDQ